MRFRTAGARMVAVAIVAVALAPAAGGAQEPVDWVFASMTVTGAATPKPPPSGGGSFSIGPGSGSSAELTIEATAHATGTGPLLIGTGAGFGGGPSFVAVDDLATGGIRFRTTNDLGGLDVEVTSASSDGKISISVSVGGSASSFTNLLFLTNAVIDTYSVKGSGGTPVANSGSGSRVIQMAGPDASGVAVDTSVVAAGASTFDALTSKGIVGGLAFGGCIRCTVTWTGPNGMTGTANQTSTPFVPLPIPVPIPAGGSIDGDFSFAGPAGAWSWSWTGVNVRAEPSPTVVGAYAPIGDLWRVFTGSGVPSVGVVAKPSPAKPQVRGTKQTRKTLPATGVSSHVVAAWLLLAAAAVAARRLVVVR